MTISRNHLTRRQALVGLGGLSLGGQVVRLPGAGSARAAQGQPAPRPFEAAIPVNGKAGPGLQGIDTSMLTIMERHGIPGAALAIAKDGRLVYAKGFGWANVETGDQVKPETVFGIASLSKPITAVAVLKLVEQGKLSLDARVFDLLAHIKPPTGSRIDPRLRTVNVRQCLNHSGGWDRAVHGDPVNWEPQICRAYKTRPPLSPSQFVSFAWSLLLNFDPGTDAKYSNIGYIILGEIVAKVSGQSYDRFVIENVLKPMDIKSLGLHAFDGKYFVGEALRYLAGSFIPLPPMQMPMVNAAGGWAGSVVDMARFLTNLDGSRGQPVLAEKTRQMMIETPVEPLKPRANGTWFGLGWDSVVRPEKTFGYFKDGSYQGMRTFMKRLPTGVNWVLLYNASMEFDPQDTQMASNMVHEVRHLVDRHENHPDVDLFKEFP